MALIVTGARGFLGKAVCEALSSGGQQIVSLGQRDGDLRDAATASRLLNGAHTVVHLAARVGGVDFLRRNAVTAYYDNFAIGSNVVAACLAGNARRLILVGTACSYHPAAQLPLDERDIFSGLASGDTGAYGLAKATVSHMANQLLPAAGKEVVTLVPTNLYGPGDNFDVDRSHVVAALVRKAIVATFQDRRQIEVWGDGTATRDLLHIRDAASVISRAALAVGQLSGETINIASGAETTMRELAELVVGAVDPNMSVVFDPSRPTGIQRRVMSIDKAKSLLDFHPSVALRPGIEETVSWVCREKIWKDWLPARSSRRELVWKDLRVLPGRTSAA
jgi:GDP-L-fucose synthase